MAGDLHYKLIVDLSTTGSLAPALDRVNKGANDATGAFTKLRDMMGGAASSVAGTFTGAVEAAAGVATGLAKIGAVAAGGALVYGVIGLNNELELTKTSIAAILNAQGMGGGSMTSALGMSSEIIRDMRKDAAELPGEFKDLIQFFRLGSTPGFALGASVGQMEKLSANAMAAAAATGINQEQAAREFAMLLQGRAGAHNIFGSMLGFTGDKAQSFNAESGDKKLKDVEAALGKYEPAIAEFSKTFDALSSTMRDNGKSVLAKMTSGVFDRVKGAMSDANKWYDAHETQVMSFANRVSETLVEAFDKGRRTIEEWTPAIMTFAGNAYREIGSIWTRVEPLVRSASAWMQKAFADPKVFDRIESVLKLYSAVKIGTMVAPSIGSGVSGFASMMGGGGVAGAAGGAGEIAALGVSAGVAAAAIAVLGTTVYGIVNVLTDDTSSLHTTAERQKREMNAHLKSVASEVEGSGIKDAFKSVANGMGTFALMIGNNLSYTLDGVVTGFGYVSDASLSAGRALNSLLGIANKLHDPPTPHTVVLGGGATRLEISGSAKGKDPDAANRHRGVPGGGGTNIQKVEIVISTNQDPSRIARAAVDKLADLSRNPTSSRMVRNWGAVRP